MRSIKYRVTIAKLSLAKDIDDFAFNGATVNETATLTCSYCLQ